jgi:hypothetical protein
MPECTYCQESFDGEEAYLDHLRTDHEESELSRIDRRRVSDDDGGEGLPTGPLILGGLLLFTILVTAYVMLFLNTGPSVAGGLPTVPSEAEQQPTDVGSVQSHGTIDVVIDGRQLNFSRPSFYRESQYPAFFFQSQDPYWHAHARGVTLEYAMATVRVAVNDTAVRYDGTVYRNSDPDTTVSITVDGEDVAPSSYVLSGPSDTSDARQGDHVEIVVETTDDG